MTDVGTSPPPPGSLDLWEDEIPLTDNSFLQIGPSIPAIPCQKEDE